MRTSNKLWFLALVGLTAATASFALAQAKPAPAKPAAAKPAPAQPPAAGHKHGDMMCDGCGECPMHAIGELAEAKVDNNAKGATVTFTAKKAEDAQKVQDLAKQIATHEGCDCCKDGSCKMMGGKGGMGKKCEKGEQCEHGKGGMHEGHHEGHHGHAH